MCSLRSKHFLGVWEQRKSEEWDFRRFARAKNGERAKKRKEWEGKGKEGNAFHSFPSPTPLLHFLALPHFSRGKNTENPVPLTFFPPKPHGNACYAG